MVEQAAELPCRVPDPVRELVLGVAVEESLIDQEQCLLDRRWNSSRRSSGVPLRPAAQAGAKTRRLGCEDVREVLHVRSVRFCGTVGTTVDARRVNCLKGHVLILHHFVRHNRT